jgi:hypothetical protein
VDAGLAGQITTALATLLRPGAQGVAGAAEIPPAERGGAG